jgi:protoporphyrinogen oxidase
MSDNELLDYAVPFIQKMFPEFSKDWVVDYHVWHAEYAQPVIPIDYSKTMPGTDTPLENVFISTMAHVYPEDRGTNYAIKHGRNIGIRIGDQILAKNGARP